MSNTANTLKNAPGVVAKMAAEMLEDELQFCKSIDKADATDFDGKNGYSAGDTIYVSRPARFTVGTSADITSAIQDITEEKVALSLDTRAVVPVAMTSAEFATEMALKAWANRVLKPAVSSMAQYIEKTFIQKATQATYNLVGTAGSNVFASDDILAARERLNKCLCPKDADRFLLLDSSASRKAVNARKGLFQSSTEISKQYKQGLVGQADGFTWLENELIYQHTNGADVATAVEGDVVTPATAAATVGMDGVTSGATITKGSVFTINSVYAVHPITKVTQNYLQQFVATAAVTETASNQVTLAIAPTIYTSSSGALQNVSALHADEAACTFVGSASTAYTQNLAFHKSAFRMVSVPLISPGGTDMSATETYKGLTIRVIRDYDVLTDKLIMRLDFLGGLAAVRPEWSCRITA